MTDVVPAVVLDDGSLTRSALARLSSIYPALDVHVIGLRADLISSLLTDMGVRAHQAPCTPSATSHDRLEQAIATVDTLGEGLLLTGPPLDGADMLRVLDDHTRDRGLVLHVLAPSGSGSHARVLAQTPEARGWDPVVGRVLAQTWGEYVSTTAGTARAEDLENGTTDVVVVAVRSGPDRSLLPTDGTHTATRPRGPSPLQGPSRAPIAIGAADIVHVELTEHGLHLSNRTSYDIRLRVRLGAVGDPSRDIATVERSLSSHQEATVDGEDLGAVRRLRPPDAVRRHWSHTTQTVFEGGERRINGVDLCYADTTGRVLATASHGSHRGLVVGVTAQDIAADLASTSAPNALAARYAAERARPGLELAALLSRLSTCTEQQSS